MWRKEHEVIQHANQQSLNINTAILHKMKVCGQQGVCVCRNRAALLFQHKLVQRMKLFFTGTAKNPSPQRTMLVDCFFVLALSPGPAEKSFFLHIGNVNFSTWDFACLLLQKLSESNEPAGHVLHTTALQDGEIHVRTIMRFLVEHVDFETPWRLQYYTVLNNNDPVSIDQMPAHHVSIQEHGAPAEFWRGACVEMPSKPEKSQASKSTIAPGGGRKPCASSATGSRATSAPQGRPLADTAGQPGAGAEGQNSIAAEDSACQQKTVFAKL